MDRIERDESASAWWYLAGGIAVGLALGLLAAPASEEEGEEGVGKRVLKRIPGRVKIAGAFGAIRGAGGEAYRELKARMERRRHRHNGDEPH
jgi:hypothetical protein